MIKPPKERAFKPHIYKDV